MIPLLLSPVGPQNYNHRALVRPDPEHLRSGIPSSRTTRLSASQNLGTFDSECRISEFVHSFIHSTIGF